MKRKPIKETFVQNSILKYLSRNKYGIVSTLAELKSSGVDIKVKNNNFGRYFLIECKGDPSKECKYPHSNIDSNVNSAIGQIISRMHTKRSKNNKYGDKYGLGFPISHKEVAIRKIPVYVAYNLNLYLFIVDSKGKVEQIDWEKLEQERKTRGYKI